MTSSLPVQFLAFVTAITDNFTSATELHSRKFTTNPIAAPHSRKMMGCLGLCLLTSQEWMDGLFAVQSLLSEEESGH
jgi:hypothetical protein